MAALTANDVSVSVSPKHKRFVGGVRNLTIADITFGDGALTYPTGGIPLPSVGDFGFHVGIDFFGSEGTPDNGYDFRYDRSNHKLLIYSGGSEIADTTTPAEQTVRALIAGM